MLLHGRQREREYRRIDPPKPNVEEGSDGT